mgnify:CR=1 FL=1|jgi:hypothetical protein
MYEKLFFKSGKCASCQCQEVVVMGTQKKWGFGICSRCNLELFNGTANLQKNRYLSGGPVNPRFNTNNNQPRS